jgi:hypothetical protein
MKGHLSGALTAAMQSKRNFRASLTALAGCSLVACTGNVESGGPGPSIASLTRPGAPSDAAGNATPVGSSAGPAVAAALPVWAGAVGSWCGPAEEQSLWLTLQPQAAECEAQSERIYSQNTSGDGLTLQLDLQNATTLPASLAVPGRYCSAGACQVVSVQLSLESYARGQGAQGSWSFDLPGQAVMAGRLDAAWCNWDSFLPAHPEAERLARNIEVREVAVYQGVKVAVMRDMQAITPRNADLVQQREAMVRVFVEPQPGYQSRELKARITLQDEGGEPRRFEQTMLIEGPSEEMDGKTTFNIELPKDAFGPTTQYSVELREVTRCVPLSGIPVGARFPETGLSPVNARFTGPVKVMLVPVRYDADGSGRLPDTSEEQLEQMRRRLYSMYPTNEVVLSVREPVGTDRTDLEDMLDQMRELRDTDAPPSDLAYYGLVRQADTFKDYCQQSCTTGIAGFGSQSGTASAGMGIGFRDSAAGTFVHELGHIYRRPHAPCGGAAGPDESYPYAEANLGSYGFDILTHELFDPANHVDFMSYCSPEWISDYNYQQILERIVVVNEHASLAAQLLQRKKGQPRRTFRSLLVSHDGQARWGLDLHPLLQPPGDPVQVEVLDAQGNVLRVVTAYREEGADGQHALFVPAGEAGWSAVRAPGLAPLEYAGVTRNRPFSR